MKKFSLEEYLAHPEKKVVDKDGNVMVICSYEFISEYYPIHAYIKAEGGGRKGYALSDLFFADEEPELTEFEQAIKEIIDKHHLVIIDKCHFVSVPENTLKNVTKELLELARKEIENEVPEMEFIPIENTLEYKAGFRAGKTEALKDLPRWKKAAQAFGNYTVAPTETGEYCLLIDGYFIMLSDLEKLPGFKED